MDWMLWWHNYSFCHHELTLAHYIYYVVMFGQGRQKHARFDQEKDFKSRRDNMWRVAQENFASDCNIVQCNVVYNDNVICNYVYL